jgi:phospholipid/cholesterol/gamma-HCH transport system substrate-binding protein
MMTIEKHQEEVTHPKRFALLSLAIAFTLICVSFALAMRNGAFENKLTLQFISNSGQGLHPGMPIFFKGFIVGYLKNLELTAEGRIDAQVAIREKYLGLATKGAYLRLSKEKIVSSELVIEPGPKEAPALKNGDEITLTADGGLDALEKRVFERVDPMIAKVNLLLARLSDPEKGLPSTIDAMRAGAETSKKTVTQLNNALAQATLALSAVNKRVGDPKIDTLLAEANKTIQGLTSNSESANKALAGVTSNTDQINKTVEAGQQLMAVAQQIMLNTQKSAQGTNKEVVESLKQTQKVLIELVQMMEDVRRSTLGRWLVAPRVTEALKGPTVLE